jgi:uncharacterized repeat protein (TIGR03837 family)
MHAALLWDLFCTVIDNHGDLGVCWRLSRQLRDAGQRVRLWVDDASALAWMAPNAGQEAGIDLRSWQQASEPAALQGLAPADVWVEAFGCHLPEAFVAHGVGTRARPPAWINLEYLSAENWVPRFHGLSSPVMSGPAKGWSKRFFYPGFTPQTGGLLRESDLLERQSRFDRHAWRAAHRAEPAAQGRLISLFCYESPGLSGLLSQLSGTNDLLLVTPGRPLGAVQGALVAAEHKPRWTALPHTSQDGFDQMLWACDLNIVRGEDSLVRALWAGQPFIWHIYPQDDQAHHAKLEAFLDWLQAPPSLKHMHALWNGLAEGELPVMDADTLGLWHECTVSARQRLLTQADLLSQLMGSLPA